MPAEPIYINKVNASLEKSEKALVDIQTAMFEHRTEIKDKHELIDKMNGFLSSFDIKRLTEKEQQILILIKQISASKARLLDIEKKEELLAEVPCGDSYPGCKFIKNAIGAVAEKDESQGELDELEKIYNSLDGTAISAQIQQYNDITGKMYQAEIRIRELELKVETGGFHFSREEMLKQQLLAKKEIYEANKEAIENLEKLISTREVIEAKAAIAEEKYNDCNGQISLLNRNVGSYEQKVINLEEQRDEANNLRKEFAAYDLFMRCMHSNGIAYDITKKRLPVINEEIAKILANLTDFEVFFEEVGNKLDIFIKHPKHDPRPLSMASGAEKTMAAMAIRLALLSVSNLPKSDIMILDEPGTSLDETHLQAFTQMLEIIKTKFRTVFLISHLDSLKDVADMTIDISKKNGFAFVNQ